MLYSSTHMATVGFKGLRRLVLFSVVRWRVWSVVWWTMSTTFSWWLRLARCYKSMDDECCYKRVVDCKNFRVRQRL